MGKYGDVAVQAAGLLAEGRASSPAAAWSIAARSTFPAQQASREKSCPKGAFLGLCEDGLIKGVGRSSSGAGHLNKDYALAGVAVLLKDPGVAAEGPQGLWARILEGRKKIHNHQMDVVLALWNEGLICPRDR